MKRLSGFLGVVVCAFCLQGMVSVARAATVAFDQANVSVGVGDSFSLVIQGSGFPTITGGGLDLSFDPAVLQIDSVTINTAVFDLYLGDGTEEGVLDNAAGTLSDTAFNSWSYASGDFDIMTIAFTAIGAGTSLLTLSESALYVFSDDNGNLIGDQISYPTTTVTVVPLPAAVWLFAGGLAGLLGVARRT